MTLLDKRTRDVVKKLNRQETKTKLLEGRTVTPPTEETTTGISGTSSDVNDHADRHFVSGDDQPIFDGVQFDTTGPTLTPAEGMIYWNDTDKTLNIKTDTETVIQIGQEQVLRGINKTGVQLDNGTVIYISGADVPSDRPTFVKADASTWEDSQTTLGVMTSDVADDAEGFATDFGLVRDVDTSGMTAGDRVYLSETAGAFTTTRPTSPAFIIEIGIVVKVDASDGIIFVNVNNNDDHGFFNGSFVESFDLTVAAAGGVITASLERTGTGNLTMRFSDGFSTLVTAPMTKVLTAGTAIAPQANYLHILQSDKTQITLSTSGYPTNVEHIKVAKVVVLTAAITQNDDALANQNVNDHAVGNLAIGHNIHLGEWIRAQPATWESGIAGNSSTGDDYLEIEAGPVAIYYRSTAGSIRQLHLQTFPVKDTGSIDGGGSDFLYVVNDPDAAYTRVTELFAGIDKLSTGAAYSNNKYQIVVFWGIQNKSGETSHIMCNVASGEYTSQSGAENDINGHTNVDIPDEFRSTGFLICKIVFQKTATTWVYKSTLDLRGTNPSIVTGAGGGAAIVSFPDNTFEIFNVADPTKLINLDASGIAAGNTRTITMPDNDVMLTPLLFNIGNVTPDLWFKLGQLSSSGAIVTVIVQSGSGFGSENQTGYSIAQFKIGNADNEFGGYFYQTGGTANPTISFEWVDDGVNLLGIYVKLPNFFRGAIDIIEGFGFTIDADPTGNLADPGGTDLTEAFTIYSDTTINGDLTNTGTIKNPTNNEGLFTGANEGVRIYDDGVNVFYKGNNRHLYVDADTAAKNLNLRTREKVTVLDRDDANVTLWELDTPGRTIQNGQVADPMTMNHHGDSNILAGSFIMDGTGADDEALQVPYLTQAPATLANGMIWMEADGFHFYSNGGETIIPGV